MNKVFRININGWNRWIEEMFGFFSENVQTQTNTRFDLICMFIKSDANYS